MSIEKSCELPYPSGYVEYQFDMHVSSSIEISCSIPHPRVREIVFKKVDPDDIFKTKWRMIVHTREVFSVGEVDQIGEEIKESIFDMLSATLDKRVSGGRMIGHNITPRPGEGFNLCAIAPAPTCKAEFMSGGKPLKKNHIDAIQNNMQNISFQNPPPYHSMFRFALSIDEPIVQFIILYMILLEKFKNRTNQSSQSEVDKTILSIAPSTPMSKSPRNSNCETIYTKLRNQITHYRNTPPEITRREIINCLDEFRIIVHKAVI